MVKKNSPQYTIEKSEEVRPTLLGRLINRLHTERWAIKETTVRDLLKRNQLDNPQIKHLVKVVAETHVQDDGTETTTFKLWKLVDRSVVSIKTNITNETYTGLEEENDLRSKQEANSTDSPI